MSYVLCDRLRYLAPTDVLARSAAVKRSFFRRADMLDTKVGTAEKDDPADVAKNGFKAPMSGEGGVVSGWQNKLRLLM